MQSIVGFRDFINRASTCSMPIELHERLSEFSYGYGVTREVENRLKAVGLSAVPFLPSLLQEGSLGFDVAFKLRGAPLMIQFKLGQAMRRFSPGPRPLLDQPFWRYHIDTAEPDGQFELLLKAEQDGADVYYVAPLFHDWEIYLSHFERSHVLQQSLILTPGAIRSTLAANGVADGDHKIVYDSYRAYVCSNPLKLETTDATELARKVRAHVDHRTTSIGEILEEIFSGFERRREIRRPTRATQPEADRGFYRIPSDDTRGAQLRQGRLNRLLAGGRSREEAVALAVGAEAWSMGAQLIFATDES